jgi:hypothetical protein
MYHFEISTLKLSVFVYLIGTMCITFYLLLTNEEHKIPCKPTPNDEYFLDTCPIPSFV